MPPAAVVLAGRGGGEGSEPKKSKPSRESLVFVVFGSAASAFGATLDATGPAVLAR